MKEPSNKRRAKKLLRMLKEVQYDDCGITPPTIYAMKYVLPLYSRCRFVEIRVDSLAANRPFDSLRSLLPRFIVSQLEEQKLTERCSEEVPVPPVAAFVIQLLPSVCGHEKLWPTLFRWHCPLRHRTYHLFARIQLNMPRRTYNLTELLSLRASQIPEEILAVARNPDIADIIRRSRSEGSSTHSGCKSSVSRHKDDSSVTSDELVFKGTMSRRMGRELARETLQASARPPTRDATKKNKPREDARELSHEPTTDPSRPMEWKYRGRAETEAASAEPIPAPTGAPAQRDEGFQRFYKAVVSPTHVRVTAGGRIVPNTRGQLSPTSKRSNENPPAADNQSVPEKTAPSKPVIAPIGLGQPVPVMPQIVTGYPQGYQPLQGQVSFVPMALGTPLQPTFSFTQPAINPASVAPLVPENALKDVHNAKPADVRRDVYPIDDKQGNARPPELFDSSKPYFYNGQLMYPVGAFPPTLGNPMMPVQMVSFPHGVAPQLPGHFMQSQPAPNTSVAAGPSYAPSNHSLSGIPPVANHIVPANANFNAATAPPISSIKLSDITRKQIASFKQSLKYHEDQLQYNRHQIDEKDMESKIQIIKGHIQKFEATLKNQLEYEEAHRKATRDKEEAKRPPQPTAAAEPGRAPPRPTPPVEYGAPALQNGTDDSIGRRIPLANYGLNNTVGDSGRAMFRNGADQAQLGVNGLLNGQPALPSEAALAPIFQPRGYASTWTSSKYAKEMKAYQEAEKRLMAVESSKSLEHLRAGEHRSVSQPFSAATAAALPQAESNPKPADSTSRSSGKQQYNFGVPYLLGVLPKGVNPRDAREQDYMYKRPLTEEERRARFLYWGKAPRSAVQGLPKFDGKHFYPPSPVKERSSGSGSGSGRDAEYPKGGLNRGTFRPVTPVQRTDATGAMTSEDVSNASRLTRSLSFETQVNSGSEELMAQGGLLLKASEDSTEASSVASADRRTDNPGGKLWESVMRKGPTSSALSSTTAQGFLPPYTGHAAASLGPSLSTNQAPPPRDVTPGKMSDVSDSGGTFLAAAPDKLGENTPPGVSSLEDQFKNLAVDVTGRRNLTSGFNM